MIKLLFLFRDMRSTGGADRALVDLLRVLPPEKYSIDLLLQQAGGILFKQIPPYVNILPPLYQLQHASEALWNKLAERGNEKALACRQEVSRLNREKGIDHIRNWQLLKEIVPVIEGYDIAVSFISDICLKVLADRVHATKKIAWVHTDYGNYLQRPNPEQSFLWPKSQDPFYRKIDKIVCVAPQNVQGFIQHFPAMENRTLFLPNIMNTERIQRLSLAQAPTVFATNDKVRIFTCARLCVQKGIDYAIQAAEILRDQYSLSFIWCVLGHKDPGGEQYQEMIEARGLQEHMVLHQPTDNPYPYYRHCDIYVQPSRYEGKSIAIEEAKLLGRPVVTTNYSSAQESVRHEETGLICEMSAQGIAGAILRLCQDAPLRRAMTETLKTETYDNGLAGYEQLLSLP